MKFIFLIILSILAMPHWLMADESSGCDQVIEEVEITPTMNLTAYLKYLLDEGVISTKNLHSFKESLHTNNFYNPIAHTGSSQNPTIYPASNYAHYVQIQQYLDFQKSNPHFLDLDKLEQLTKELIQTKSLTMSSRSGTKFVTNFHLVLEQILDGGLSHIDDLLDSLAKNSPHSSTKLAIQLLSYYKVPYYQEIGAKLLLKIYLKQDYSSLLYLMGFHIKPREMSLNFLKLIDPFLNDNGTEEYYRFATSALSAPISNEYKERILLKLKKTSNESLLKIIKRLAQSNMHIPLSIAAVKALYQTQKAEEILPYFVELATGPNTGFWIASMEAEKYLFEFKIRGYKFDLPSYDIFNRDGCSIFESLSYFYGKSDSTSLELIKEAVSSTKIRKNKIDAVGLLRGRKDDESLLYIKSLFTILPDKEQLRKKLEVISGRDTPWVLSFIQKYLNNNDTSVQAVAYKALENMHSLESRNIIETLYLEKVKEHEKSISSSRYSPQTTSDINNQSQDMNWLLKTLETRPENDVIYFVDKYINSQNKFHLALAIHSLRSLQGINNQKIKNICLVQVTQNEGFAKKACTDYLKSLPIQENLPLWRYLIKESFSKTENVEALERFIGQYDQEIIEFCFQTFKNNISNMGNELNEISHHASACFRYLTYFPVQQFIERWRGLATPPFDTKIKKLALEILIQANDQTSKNLLTYFLENTEDESKYLLSELIDWAPNSKIHTKCSAQEKPNISLGCLEYLYHQPTTDELHWWKAASQKPYSDSIRGMALTKLSEHFDLEIGQILKKIINENHPELSPRARSTFLFHYLNMIEKIEEHKILVSDDEIAFFE